MDKLFINTEFWPIWVVTGLMICIIIFLSIRLWLTIQQNVELQEKADAAKKTEKERNTYQQIARDMQPAADLVNDLRKGIIEAAKEDRPMVSTVELLQKFLSTSYTKDALHILANHAHDSEIDLKSIKKIEALQGKIQAFFDELQQQEPPSDILTQRRNRSQFISLAMMAIDVVESIDNNEASEKRQGLNVKLMLGEIFQDEVRTMAKRADDKRADQCQLWAKALQTAMRTGMDLDEEQLYLLGGYIFQGYNMQEQNN